MFNALPVMPHGDSPASDAHSRLTHYKNLRAIRRRGRRPFRSRPLKLAIHLLEIRRRSPMVQTPNPRHDQKTIFVVDDNPAVLKGVAEFLADHDYHVLTWGSGVEALLQSRAYKGEIHLLLSDFQMPAMSGVELATAMTAERPQLKVLLMSGFSEGMLVLNEGWHFLAKPFIASQLSALVTGMVSPDISTRFSA